jgi:hypothetical protein
MAENIELLIQIQDQIIKCRRLAASIGRAENSPSPLRSAEEFEQRAREVDREP